LHRKNQKRIHLIPARIRNRFAFLEWSFFQPTLAKQTKKEKKKKAGLLEEIRETFLSLSFEWRVRVNQQGLSRTVLCRRQLAGLGGIRVVRAELLECRLWETFQTRERHLQFSGSETNWQCVAPVTFVLFVIIGKEEKKRKERKKRFRFLGLVL
jgi:hypothetical protein